MRRSCFFACLVACAPPALDDTGTAPNLADTGSLDLPAPVLSADEIASAIAEADDALLTVSPSPVIAAYEQALAEADESCPAFYSSTDGPYWYDDCVTTEGAHFDGYGTEIAYDGVLVDGASLSGRSVGGGGTVETVAGHTLSLHGSAWQVEGSDAEGARVLSVALSGELGWDGPEAEGTWLESGLSGDFGLTLSWGVAARSLTLSGSLAGLSGPVSAVAWEGFLLASADAGSPCEAEPAGTIAVRDADGHWTEVLFDVPWDASEQRWGEMSAQDCDGCGEAWFEGLDLGEVCLDFSRLLEGEDAPL